MERTLGDSSPSASQSVRESVTILYSPKNGAHGPHSRALVFSSVLVENLGILFFWQASHFRMFFSSLRFRLSSCWRRSYGRCVSRVHPQRGEQQLKLQTPSQLFPPHDQNVPSQSEVQPLSQLSSHSLTIRPRRLSGNSPWSPRTCSSAEGTSLPCASPSEGSPQPLTVESIIARWINIVVEESMCVRLLSSARGCEAARGR